MVVPRTEMRETLARLCSLLTNTRKEPVVADTQEAAVATA
jgi:hypothetical protein